MYTSLISTETLAQHVADENWAIIDCRFSLAHTEQGFQHYLQGHIPGAVYAHLDDDLSGQINPGKSSRHPLPDPEEFAQTLGSMGIGPGVQVIAYDDFGGGIAARLWWMLRWLGHEAVAVLDGGWPAWASEDRPSRKGRETRPAREFIPYVNTSMILSSSEIDKLRLEPQFCLIDVRASERYRGEVEPIDTIAGHIPGAVNIPWPESVGPEGYMLDQAALRVHFQTVVGDHPVEQMACYCGSGVTACHTLLALFHAGMGEARLYAGSWSEWITDPTRPVAVGD